MIGGPKRKELNDKAIFSKISEYDLFRFYMPHHDWKLNHPTLSPFRHENNPSFLISSRNGFLFFIDFTDTNIRGNAIQFVGLITGITNYNEILERIDTDLKLGIRNKELEDYQSITKAYKQPIDMVKHYSVIQVKPRAFTKEELAYWNQYYQDIEDLKKNNIYSVDKVYLNKQRFSLPDNELRFGYFYAGAWKIYRPYADKKNKWLPNNVPITTMDGLEDIKNCEVAFINKSKKDYMVMKKIFPCTCAVQNEGIACFSQENVDYLKANSKSQILSFDSDTTGVANSQQITQLFDFGYCNVPRKYLRENIKDWADLAKNYGLKTIEDYLKEKNIL